MSLEELKGMVAEMELALEFDNVEAERCSMCCAPAFGGC